MRGSFQYIYCEVLVCMRVSLQYIYCEVLVCMRGRHTGRLCCSAHSWARKRVVLVVSPRSLNCEVVLVYILGSLYREVVLVRMRGWRRRYSCGPNPPPAELWARVFRDIIS
jgi:hypothetical protein